MLGEEEYNKASRNLDKITSANAGTAGAAQALRTGTVGASSVGQTAGQAAAGGATNAGMTKGQAAGIGQNVANEQTANSIQSEAAKAQEKQNEEIKEAQNKVGEAAEQRKEKVDAAGKAWGGLATGALSGASTGALIGSAVPGLGTAIGAGVGALGGALVSGLANIPSFKKIFSDDRLKYKSRIKDQRLLNLRGAE